VHKKANDIVSVANEFVGVPYRHQGRNSAGMDCAGVVILTAHRLVLTEKDTTTYSRRPNAAEFTAFMLETGCRQLPYGAQEHGDILRFNTEGWPVHLGILEIDDRGMEWYIHAFALHKKVTRDPLTAEVKRSINSVWRFPK